MRITQAALLRAVAVAVFVASTSLPAHAVVASPWQFAPAMVNPRGSFSTTALADGRLLATGGGLQRRRRGAVRRLRPSDAHVERDGKLNVARVGHAQVTLKDGRVMVMGGNDWVHGEDLRSAEIYDPASGKWTLAPDMAYAGWFARAVVLQDGRVFVHNGMAAAAIYDPAQNKWSSTSPFLPGATR